MGLQLLCIGLNFQSAPVSIREKLHAIHTDKQMSASVSRMLGEVLGDPRFVLFTTCNRVELYVSLPSEQTERVERHVREGLAVHGGVTYRSFEKYLYRYIDNEAVRHLARVACGLESMVVGETEVLGQANRAFEAARTAGTVDSLLRSAWKHGLRAGKRARGETGISANAASVASAAVSEARGRTGGLDNASVLLIGAGDVGAAAFDAIRLQPTGRTIVMSRTLERARSLCGGSSAEPASLERLEEVLSEVDVVLCGSGADRAIVTADALSRARAGNPGSGQPEPDNGQSEPGNGQSEPGGRPLLIIDIAVPRDVEPECGDLPGVTLVDIDGLAESIRGNLADRCREVPWVEAIVAEELGHFARARRIEKVRPVLRDLYRHGENVRTEKLEALERELADLDDEQWAAVERFSRALVAGILHAPGEAIRIAAELGDTEISPEAARETFGLGRDVS